MPSSPIRNIIFDLGAVLLNIDYQLTMQAFARLGFDPSVQFTREAQSGIFNRFERGEISTAVFFDEMRKLNAREMSDAQLTEAWNAMLLDMPLHRIRFIEELQPQYRLFLLSNTNSVHIKAFWDYAGQLLGPGRWDNLFEKSYYSHLMGKRKPEPEIYLHVLQDAGLEPQETLFVDDSPHNLEAAEKVGIRTLLIDADVVAQLKPFLLQA